MERLTGKGAQSLNEAYSQVYSSVLTEEVINSTAEQWVSACIEEGIKFEEYTLDEITEAFIADCDQPEVLNEFLGMQGAQNFGANLRQKFGQARRAVGGALANVGRGVKDVAGAYGQGFVGQKTTSQNPLARGLNAVSRGMTAVPRAVAAGVGGFLTGKSAGGGTAPAAPAGNTVASQAPPAAAGAPAARKPAQSPTSNLKTGSPNTVVSPKSGEETKFERRLPSMAELRAAQAARAKAKAAGASDKEAGYQAVKAGVNTNAGKVTQGRPDAKIDPASVQAALKKVNSSGPGTGTGAPKPTAAPAAAAKPMAAAGAAPTPTPRPRPTGARPMGARNRIRMGEELDVFDTIKEYLIGEGATEEEALQQMLTLTDEQRTEILEGSCGSKKKTTSKKKGGY